MSTIVGYICMTETVLVTSDDGLKNTYFKVNFTFPYYSTTFAAVTCGCDTGTTFSVTHYQVTVDDIDYYIPDIYATKVSEDEGIDSRTRQERIIEESKMSQINDFHKKAEKYLGVDIKRSWAPEWESEGIKRDTKKVNPGVNENG